MNWPHYRVIVARVGVLAFGLLVILLIGKVVTQAGNISALTDRLAAAENQRALDERAFRAEQEQSNAARQAVMLDGIRALQLAIGTASSPQVQAAVNELLEKVRTASSGSSGPSGPTGAQGPQGPAGVGPGPTTTSTAQVTSTTTTRPPTTTTSSRPPTTTTTRRGCIDLGVIRVGCGRAVTHEQRQWHRRPPISP